MNSIPNRSLPGQELLPEHRLFDVPYLMAILKLKANAVYRLCRKGLISHYKVNNLIYFRQEDIDEFLQQCRVKRR